MATIPLPPDFSAFLKLLNTHKVKYLLIGGYAVGYHGYVRATADMDIWAKKDKPNAEKLVKVVKEFGFDTPELTEELFLHPDNITRMGVPPVRIEILTNISSVVFDECYAKRVNAEWDDVLVPVINLKKLIKNKKASGRLKDLADAEQLEKLL